MGPWKYSPVRWNLELELILCFKYIELHWLLKTMLPSYFFEHLMSLPCTGHLVRSFPQNCVCRSVLPSMCIFRAVIIAWFCYWKVPLPLFQFPGRPVRHSFPLPLWFLINDMKHQPTSTQTRSLGSAFVISVSQPESVSISDGSRFYFLQFLFVKPTHGCFRKWPPHLFHFP
jgi:hypothetical protein